MLPSSRGQWGLVVHHLGSGSLLHHLRIRSLAHNGVLLFPLATRRLEGVEVELHAVAHGGHVEKWAKVFFWGGAAHVVVLPVPA